MCFILSNQIPNKFEIRNKIIKFYQDKNIDRLEIERISWFLDSLEGKKNRSRWLICPHCGKEGWLTTKTTVSKKKYSYIKLYVYHSWWQFKRERVPYSKTTDLLRYHPWCYLNHHDRESSTIKEALQNWTHFQNIENYFYRSVVFPQ